MPKGSVLELGCVLVRLLGGVPRLVDLVIVVHVIHSHNIKKKKNNPHCRAAWTVFLVSTAVKRNLSLNSAGSTELVSVWLLFQMYLFAFPTLRMCCLQGFLLCIADTGFCIQYHSALSYTPGFIFSLVFTPSPPILPFSDTFPLWIIFPQSFCFHKFLLIWKKIRFRMFSVLFLFLRSLQNAACCFFSSKSVSLVITSPLFKPFNLFTLCSNFLTLCCLLCPAFWFSFSS